MTDILGGSSSGQSQQSSQSGFSQLPPSLQQAFTQYGTALNTLTGNAPTSTTSAFTPQDLNSGSTGSLSALANNNYAPTAANINSSVDEQMNPYNQDVINLINKNAYGANSVLNQNLNAAGQFGSNRAALGANDIANTQANTIGALLNPEFNTAMTNALTTIPQAFQTSATNSVSSGLTTQNQALMKATAPYTGLAAYSQLLGNIPQSGGSTSQGSSSQSAGSGLFGFGQL